MERLKRIAELWNWLPAFRAVAETEHLNRAAEMLGISAPALSRTIRLLEDSLDAPLFHRTGGHLQLTELGRALAAATRDSMRRVDEVIAGRTRGIALAGPLRISTDERLAAGLLLGALLGLRRAHPLLVPHVTSAPTRELVSQLLRGDLDAALVIQPTPHDDIVVERVLEVSHGVYCGQAHPLFELEAPSLADILEHAFVAPPQLTDVPVADGWPAEHPRRIVLTSSLLDARVEACSSGEMLGVFADSIVASFTRGAALRRLPGAWVPALHLYVMTRAPVAQGPSSVAALLAELRRELGGHQVH